MRNIKLIIAWDGTDFSGWQRQNGGDRHESRRNGAVRTVQGEIEKALKRLHKHPVTLTGAGRTDAGVHAAAQTAHFCTDIDSMEALRFVPALNSLLPSDVRVLEAAGAAPSFHARFDAKARTYRYFFISGRQGLPHETRYALQLWRRPRLDVLNTLARTLRGETDCRLFADAGDRSLSRMRHIFRAWFFMDRDTLVFEVRANAFLRKMVRGMAGTLLYCEEKNAGAETLREMMRSGDRSLAGPTLPPQGLFLWKVEYYAPPPFDLRPPKNASG